MRNMVAAVEYMMRARESDVVVDRAIDHTAKKNGNLVVRTIQSLFPLTRERCITTKSEDSSL